MAHSLSRTRAVCASLVLSAFAALPAAAQAPFEGGWTLNPEMSNLSFQSVKKQTVVESSGFATFQGEIDETGAAPPVKAVNRLQRDAPQRVTA